MLTKLQMLAKVEEVVSDVQKHSEPFPGFTGYNGAAPAPIFEIMMMEKLGDKTEQTKKGKPKSGFPDTGCTANVGFYHSLEDAYEAITSNMCDIRENTYRAAFLLCRFPGLYSAVDKDWRMYFVYNEETRGYEQQEEPKLLEKFTY